MADTGEELERDRRLDEALAVPQDVSVLVALDDNLGPHLRQSSLPHPGYIARHGPTGVVC